MKKCNRCNKEKELTCFGTYNNRGKILVRRDCNECRSKIQQTYYKKNRDVLRNKDKTPEALQKQKEYRELNKKRVLANKKKWRDKNKGKQVAILQKRRAAKRNRTPVWLSDSQIKAIQTEYELAAWCTKVTGIIYHVDHIVPLRGKTVSGLHVPWNLQVIPAKDNLAKGNKFEQD